MFANSEHGYRVLARFQAMHGPATSLAFSHDGTYIASGGDNELVHIWDLEKAKPMPILSDRLERWGQITCIKWLEGAAQARNYTLCFGTGRGYILVYERTKDADSFRELTCRAIFPFNDPVEAIDYDGHRERLVASSHAGKVAMYSVAKQATFLEVIWAKRLSELVNGKGTIPRVVHFVGGGESVIICGLETGIIFSKASNSGNDNWNQQIKSSIGYSCISPNGDMVLVDNLVDGFDMYTFPALEHSDFFEIPRSESYIHGRAFVEGSKGVACGSDHGQVYLFSTKTGKCIEKLRIGTKKSMIQAVDAVSNERRHLIAGATNDNNAEIIIWKKLHDKSAQSRASDLSTSMKAMVVFNIVILVAALVLFFPFQFCRESPLDKMVMLRRQSEEALAEAKAWQLSKARTAQDIGGAHVVNVRRREMAPSDDAMEHLWDGRVAQRDAVGTEHRADIRQHVRGRAGYEHEQQTDDKADVTGLVQQHRSEEPRDNYPRGRTNTRRTRTSEFEQPKDQKSDGRYVEASGFDVIPLEQQSGEEVRETLK